MQADTSARNAGSRSNGSWWPGHTVAWIVGIAGLMLGSVGLSAVNAPLIISEFRLRGSAGVNDEYIEIYNNSDSPHTVATTDGSSGYAVAASSGGTRFVIPNGTVIPARGHYLGVNSVGYSLASYPAGTGTATGNASYTTDIPLNAGIALFNTSTAANFNLANRLDAIGSNTEANTLYKEGTGYNALTGFDTNYTLFRNICPVTSACSGLPQDTDDNASDIVYADTNGTFAGLGQKLGAPGPKNLSSPIRLVPSGSPALAVSLVDPGVNQFASPNAVRDLTSVPASNSTFGTMTIRRKVTNNSGASITRLRFRILDLTTFPSPSGTADLRPITSSATTVALSSGGTATVQGTTLEEPPAQPNGGGFNSTLSAGTIALGTPLASGSSINVQFLLGIQQTGAVRFSIILESLPAAASNALTLATDTEALVAATNEFLISEFRLRGPSGANDEYVEIYNNSDVSKTVEAVDGSAGYTLATSSGARFTIPNGTVIPARGHYLGVDSVSYSIGAYPAGSGTTATGDATFTTDIADNQGLALFRTANTVNFVLANRFDAAGFTTESNTLYKEGAGIPALTPFSIDDAFYRNIPTTGGGAGLPQDTDNNSVDFLFVDTNGTSAGAGQRLGAPGPENLSGPTSAGSGVILSSLDVAHGDNQSPNIGRDLTSSPATNSTFGTISVRRTITNTTGSSLTRLRFRIIDLTTFPSPSGVTDLRPLTSGSTMVALTNGSVVTVLGTTLEQASVSQQPNGGGFNSSMSVTSVSTGTPLLNGASVNVQFLLGLQQAGCYRYGIIPETQPGGGRNVFLVTGISDAPTSIVATATTPTNVLVSWNGAPCAVSYDIYRSAPGVSLLLVGSTASTSFNDNTASPGTSYIYYVRAEDASSNSSPISLPDLATTIFFTDPTLTANATPFKAAHITELRTAVDAVRALAGLGPGSYTDPTITAGSSMPTTTYITDLRTALNAARSALGLSSISYTDPTLVANTTTVKAAHVDELRNGVK